jgi:hypothetical protein
VRHALAQRRRRLDHVAGEQRHRSIGGKWRVAADHLIEDAAERILIRRRPDALADDLLGRHVFGRAHRGAGFGEVAAGAGAGATERRAARVVAAARVVVERRQPHHGPCGQLGLLLGQHRFELARHADGAGGVLGDAEVDDLDEVGRAIGALVIEHEDVVGLQIAVHDSFVVHRLHAVRDLRRDAAGAHQIQAVLLLLFHEGGQRRSLDELHDQEGLAVAQDAEVGDIDGVGVRDFGGQLRFLQEAALLDLGAGL